MYLYAALMIEQHIQIKREKKERRNIHKNRERTDRCFTTNHYWFLHLPCLLAILAKTYHGGEEEQRWIGLLTMTCYKRVTNFLLAKEF